jgi:hypothetical protein
MNFPENKSFRASPDTYLPKAPPGSSAGGGGDPGGVPT